MKVVVIGVGNLLLMDEGFGVQVAKILQQHFQFPPGVSVVDGGTLGWELVPILEEADSFIIIDAILGNHPPGTFYRFEDDEVTQYFRQKLSAHEAGIQEVLAYLQMKGKTFRHRVVLGVEPQTIDTGLILSSVASAAVPRTLSEICSLLKSWGVPASGGLPSRAQLTHYLRSMVP